MSNIDEDRGKIIKLPPQKGVFIRHGRDSTFASRNVLLCTLLSPRSSSSSSVFFFESIRFVQHLTHCPGWLSQTWKARAEMLSLMPDTWCRFGGDCTTGTVLPLSQSQKVPEVFPFLFAAVFVSTLLCHPTLQPLSESAPVFGLVWGVCIYPSFDTHYSDCLRYFLGPRRCQ